MICPARRHRDGSPQTPSAKEIRAIAGCPVKLAEIRSRLSDIAWWMRLLCQRVATRSNKEDCQSGRFFQDRYKATLLADEASVLACAAYVDLNVIRAAMAETIEASDHTSAQRRFKAKQHHSPLRWIPMQRVSKGNVVRYSVIKCSVWRRMTFSRR